MRDVLSILGAVLLAPLYFGAFFVVGAVGSLLLLASLLSGLYEALVLCIKGTRRT